MAFDGLLWTEEHSLQYYSMIKESPVHRCVIFQSALHYLEDLKGKSVLDIGCGPGRFCRMLKKKGASYVLGVDCSPAMMEYAKQDDIKEGIQCEYKLADARNLEKIGEFDLVMMINVLQLLSTYKDLELFCKCMYDNLKPGKFCCVVAFNPFIDMNLGDSYAKYGFSNITRIKKMGDSTEFNTKVGPSDNSLALLRIKLYMFDSEDYEKAFLKAGFKSVEVKPVIVDEKLRQEYPDDFWDEYLKTPTHICYLAYK